MTMKLQRGVVGLLMIYEKMAKRLITRPKEGMVAKVARFSEMNFKSIFL